MASGPDESAVGDHTPNRPASFDSVLRDDYAEIVRMAMTATLPLLALFPSPGPVHGPLEPDPTVVFDGDDIRVGRRCNGEPVLWIRTGEFYDWERIDRDQAMAVMASLQVGSGRG